jgi:upstream activation factor subunit UAF30
MSIAEGDQLAIEQSQDDRLRFVKALPRTAENRVDFSLGSQARRVLIARCQPRRKPPPPKTPSANPCNPTPHWPQWSAKTHSPRTELTKKLWEYIRKHELQDPKEKRNIRADERLLAVFDGKKVVSMFEMTKLVNGHLV